MYSVDDVFRGLGLSIHYCQTGRAPSVPDLFIAATAELAGLIELHADKDFDLIASVTSLLNG